MVGPLDQNEKVLLQNMAADALWAAQDASKFDEAPISTLMSSGNNVCSFMSSQVLGQFPK